MPITDIGSYVPTGQEFEAHWADVDADRIANALTALLMPDGYGLGGLTANISALQAAITGVEDLDNALAGALVARDTLRAVLRDRIIEFRQAVEYRLMSSGYVRALTETPHEQASEQKMLRALDDVSSIWARINADATVPNFTPPLLLRAGYALATFVTDLAALRAAYKAVTVAENDLRIDRVRREQRLDPLRSRMVSYRQAIEVEYGAEHAFFISLPDVYGAPGSTPDPVTASGGWDAIALDAEINFTESTNPNLASYKIYMSRSATFDASTATLIATLLPGANSHRTTVGLENSGDTATYRVVVVLSTGNESSSNTVLITRP